MATGHDLSVTRPPGPALSPKLGIAPHPKACRLRMNCMPAVADAPAPLRVLVCEPDRFARDAIAAAVDHHPGYTCVEPCGHTPLTDQVDAVLAAYRRLDATAVADLHALRSALPDTPIVTIAGEIEQPWLTATERHAIVVLSPSVPLHAALTELQGRAGPAASDPHAELPRVALAALSEREVEVLHLVAAGFNPGSVARELGITLHTCRDHLKHIRAKLDCPTTLQAVLTATRLGIVPVPTPGLPIGEEWARVRPPRS